MPTSTKLNESMVQPKSSKHTFDFKRFGRDILAIAEIRNKSAKAVCRECLLSSNVVSMLVRNNGGGRISADSIVSLAKWGGLSVDTYIILRDAD